MLTVFGTMCVALGIGLLCGTVLYFAFTLSPVVGLIALSGILIGLGAILLE